MASYYVNQNAQPTGEHEVHVFGCTYFPSNRTYLGEFDSCGPAVAQARLYYGNVDGCYWCCRPCHTR
jgi:hypothetical protein